MKKTFLLVVFAILLSSSHLFAQSFGAGLTLDTTTTVSTILDNPETYLGKKVQVKGLIVDVCARRGCWIYIAGDKPFQKLRFKVTDGWGALVNCGAERPAELVSEVEACLARFADLPMTICWVLKDFVFDRHFLNEWQQRFPDAEVHSFADCGHYILEDAGDEVIPIIERFLEAHPLGATANTNQ